MKKLLLSLVALLATLGAWAQETETFVAPEAGKFYIIKGDHATHHWLTGVVEGEGIDVSDNKENVGVYYYDGTSLKLKDAQSYIGKSGSHISLVSSKTNVTITSHGNAGKYIINVGGHNLYNNQSDYTREAAGLTSDPGNDRYTWGFIEVPFPTPILTLKDLGTTTYPYELPTADIDKLKGLGSMTIVAMVKTVGMGGRKALVCAADPTQAACIDQTKDDSPYFGFGFYDYGTSYLASSRGGDRFSGGKEISSNSWHYVAYVIDETAGTVKLYADGALAKNAFTNGDAEGYQLQTFKKLFNNESFKSNAKIYIGGGKVKTGNWDTFNGKIYNVCFYDKALTGDEIKALNSNITLPKPGHFYRISYDYGNTIGKQYLQGETSPVNKYGQNTPPIKYTTETGASSIFYYTNDGLLSYSAGKYVKEERNDRGLQPIGTTQAANITPSKRDINKVVVNLGYYLHANTSGANYYSDHCQTDGCTAHDHSIECVEELPVVIGEAGYATFYCPVAVTLPAGLKAYYVSETTGSYAKMEEINGVIPANTGVILEGTPNTYNLTIAGTAESVTNKLSGTVAATYITDEAYVLSKPDGAERVGLYKATKNQQNGASWLNNGFKAYLRASEVASEARFLVFDFGTETAIESVEAETATDAVVYDLAGRRVKAAQKGLYIVNGKVVIK